jgi:methyl-accepting chemotaxis protein
MKYRNSVGARLMLAFGGVIILFAVAVALSIGRLAAFSGAINDITHKQLAKVETADAWAASLSESMRHARNMLIMEDKAQIHGEAVKIRALSQKEDLLAQQMTSLVESAEGKAILKTALDASTTLKPLDEEYLLDVQAGDFKLAKNTLLERSRPAQLALIAALQQLTEHERDHIHGKAQDIATSAANSRTWLLILSAAAVAAACLLAFLITRSIKGPLNHAVAVLGQIESGNYANTVIVSSQDEIGQTLACLDRMQTALRERTEKEHAAAVREHAAAMENSRIRTALDRVSVGSMLGDADGKIIYANDALLSLFLHQANEIRKDVPEFDPSHLVGSSFDMFHQIPALQRSFLSNLTGTHTIDLKMGAATLRAVINPVSDAAGQRVGTVVQWTDRTQEVATEAEVQAIVAKATEGDLTARIRVEGKEGFFKTLAGGVNSLLSNTADVVRSMSRAASEVRTGAEEISRGNADLSQRTEEQASSLEETASSMEEMTSAVKNNADNASQASQLASAAREQAERGGSVVGAAVVAMAEINASSKRIADIIGVIDEIAFQTNLLALNAAVEAARAGEQGRGFAVVASEVRNLALRSAEAAKEIKTLIQDSVGKVTEGTRLVDDSGKALAEIVVRVKRVTDVMEEIASSSREQATGIEQVNKAITTMDEVTQQNAALVEEASAAAQALSDQAANLTQMISRYRLAQESSEDAPGAVAATAAAAAAAPAIERRSPLRPLTGKKRSAPVAIASTSPHRVAAASRTEEWKEF